jgi:adenosylcobyric acid synthase
LTILQWLEQRGFARELRRLAAIGIPIVGICGGFQMLGVSIEDPWGIENQGEPCQPNGARSSAGANRAARKNRAARSRLACDAAFSVADSAPQVHFEGYEIHVGETFYETGAHPLADIERQETKFVADGAVNESGRVFGTYVHGFFDNDDFRHGIYPSRARSSISLPPSNLPASAPNAKRASIAWRTI